MSVAPNHEPREEDDPNYRSLLDSRPFFIETSCDSPPGLAGHACIRRQAGTDHGGADRLRVWHTVDLIWEHMFVARVKRERISSVADASNGHDNPGLPLTRDTTCEIVPDLERLAFPVDRLTPLRENPRQGDVQAAARSYATFGQRKPIVAKREGDGGIVIAGNHQLAAARELGWEKIAVVWVDDDDITAKAFALADNRTADLGTYDDSNLLAMLQAVHDADAGLFASTAYDEDALAALIGEPADPGERRTRHRPRRAARRAGHQAPRSDRVGRASAVVWGFDGDERCAEVDGGASRPVARTRPTRHMEWTMSARRPTR